ETTSISGEQVRDDNNNPDSKREEKDRVNPTANGKQAKAVKETSAKNRKNELKDLPKYDEEKKLEYTVT
ncbi:Cna B-type domain-containing protein, partial [Staphylococcus aureus]